MDAFAPASRIGPQHAGVEVQRPELMHAGHGDVERPRREGARSQGERKSIDRAGPASANPMPGFPGSRDGGHLLDAQIDPADRVIAPVGDVERVAVQRHPFRTVETRFVKAAVREPLLAAFRSPSGSRPRDRSSRYG